jgi:broad specificity phosphatase PhoE
MKSAVQTSRQLPTNSLVEWRALREIESGVCDGLTYDQIKVRYPKEFHARQQDKLTYRYPRGESYFDVITRLEPLIFEVSLPPTPPPTLCNLLIAGLADGARHPPTNHRGTSCRVTMCVRLSAGHPCGGSAISGHRSQHSHPLGPPGLRLQGEEGQDYSARH